MRGRAAPTRKTSNAASGEAGQRVKVVRGGGEARRARERADDRGKRVTVEAKTRRRCLYGIIALGVDASVAALVLAGVEVHVYVCLAVD